MRPILKIPNMNYEVKGEIVKKLTGKSRPDIQLNGILE